MAEPGWFEIRAVLRIDPDRLDQAKAWLEDSGLAEVNRIDVIPLDNQLRGWDGGRPPGTTITAEEARAFEAEAVSHVGRPALDGLRRGLHLHEQ